jgi:CspA family cold shock protein
MAPTECMIGDAMPLGTVKWFDTVRGFGLIQPDDGSKDVFVHIAAVARADLGAVAPGQRLSFERAHGRAGRTAAIDLKTF